MGFYKLEDELMCAPNMVCGTGIVLIREEKDTYQYPVDGWYWFDSIQDARIFFGLPDPSIEE